MLVIFRSRRRVRSWKNCLGDLARSNQPLLSKIVKPAARGFGFVEMSSQEEGEKAIAELNGQEVSGREIKVNEAKPREDRGGRGGGGGGGYGGGGGGRSNRW